MLHIPYNKLFKLTYLTKLYTGTSRTFTTTIKASKLGWVLLIIHYSRIFSYLFSQPLTSILHYLYSILICHYCLVNFESNANALNLLSNNTSYNVDFRYIVTADRPHVVGLHCVERRHTNLVGAVNNMLRVITKSYLERYYNKIQSLKRWFQTLNL